MLSSGIRINQTCRQTDLISFLRSFITEVTPIRERRPTSTKALNNVCSRHFSASCSSRARLPYFHKQLKKKPKSENNPMKEAVELDHANLATKPASISKSSSLPSSSPSILSSSEGSSTPSISKRQAFKSITPPTKLMNEIRILGLGAKAETWSFDNSDRGNKTIRPWDKKLSPDEWKQQQRENRLPAKKVWFEQKTKKIVEKEEVKFPGMRFVAGASTMKSVPHEEALLKLIRPNLFDELEEIDRLLKDSRESLSSSSPFPQDQESSSIATARLKLSPEEIKELEAKKRAKEWEIKDSVLQEIAIVGRSNVGKSTMLNTLTDSPNTARVSSKPGLTRQLNFYRCGEKFVVVDMPGYGFAFAKEEDKNNWKELIEEYLSSRKTLRRIYVMIDARHGLKVADKEFLSMLDSKSKKFQVVLTKCDLVNPPDLARCYMLVQEELKKTYRHAISERLLMISSYTGAGMNNLRKDMLFVLGYDILVRDRERPKSTLR
ncbi:hypothetical protein BX616_002217 [Lobosporangium transversale]|uniref:p-loop containing nucleoside triphosphate hydrolase protein n=1 Tax=Lobosporangium transversale TaxID=64571 RepID=A0A1Y2H529_9FUNG|nr:P-loop containing nucleoside triphosphate hydrolase protein [Lobosporangium transversale]KAF9917000.1 hypothetical protein BX616_002217 [Lobosporangium transversale]ORZ28142.1 P-loop containing nucleoside triphosphate hydrolase protein [Lobosporangium transversale]|eukprot:XP_021885827.1 P-loop containing nucleoside triphosphate hydrolase protein [Lobosporangium transversale]